MKLVLNALGSNTIVVMPASCFTIIAGPWPQSSLQVPVFHTAFATGPAVASGAKRGCFGWVEVIVQSATSTEGGQGRIAPAPGEREDPGRGSWRGPAPPGKLHVWGGSVDIE